MSGVHDEINSDTLKSKGGAVGMVIIFYFILVISIR